MCVCVCVCVCELYHPTQYLSIAISIRMFEIQNCSLNVCFSVAPAASRGAEAEGERVQGRRPPAGSSEVLWRTSHWGRGRGHKERPQEPLPVASGARVNHHHTDTRQLLNDDVSCHFTVICNVSAKPSGIASGMCLCCESLVHPWPPIETAEVI